MSFFDRLVSLTIPAVPKPIVRQFSKRYIAGVSVDDAFGVVRDLARQGAMSTIDILGEFIHRPEEATANTEEYIHLLRRIEEEGLDETNVSVKLSALGLLLDPRICLDNMRRILTQAREMDNFVRIDMEDSECTTVTIEVYRTLGEEYPDSVGLVLQSRLRRTLDDLESLASSPANYRLCKGIYLELSLIHI